MPIQMENLTERLQRHLGVQQAQTLNPDDMSADAIARLVGRRGDVTSLLQLWDPRSRKDVVVDFRAVEHDAALAELVRVLDATIVVQREKSSGRPKTFRPLCPDLVIQAKAGQLYRELGRSVLDGLWRPLMTKDLGFGEALRCLVEQWSEQHPLARLIKPLCRPLKSQSPDGGGNLAMATASDQLLGKWIDKVVAQDWKAFIRVAATVSADEQLDLMNGLVGLHLHMALLHRLRGAEAGSARPAFFVAATRSAEEDRACDRGAFNCFNFWRDRALQEMRAVARQIIRETARLEPELERALAGTSWMSVGTWSRTEIRESGKKKRATTDFQRYLQEGITGAEQRGSKPTPEGVEFVLVTALYNAFDTASGPATKVKDFLRNTGRAAGIVGPEGAYRRKRYQLDDRAIEMLARLHAARPDETILSDEDERQSVGAFLDDLAERYGMIVTVEREIARCRVDEAVAGSAGMRALRSHFPSEQAMALNREFFEARLDVLRCVRRYSDASSVVHFG
jgi:hypothetical protein